MSVEQENPPGWTGERYIPEIGGNIRLEHVHRYLIARELSPQKRVLDIACGEGYGSDMLATVAAHVLGVDIAPDVVAGAATRYKRPNLEFRQGACESIPLPDHSVDLVVSFETLEHIERHEDMLREIRRVLCDDGLLLISSPERHEYSDVIGNRNRYHVKELYRDEFERLLRSHFQYAAVGGQRVGGGSIVVPLNESADTRFVTFPFAGANANGGEVQAPVYLLALACDQPLPAMPVGLLDGGPFSWTSEVSDLLAQVQGQCALEIARRLGDVIQLDGASNEAIRTQFVGQADRVSEVNALLGRANASLAAAHSELAAVRATSEALAGDLAASRATSEALAGDLAASRATSEALAGDLAASRATSEALAGELAASRALSDGVASELAAFRALNDSLAADAAASRAMSDARAAEVSRLVGVETALNAEIESGRLRATRLESQLVDAHAKLAGTSAALATANSDLAASHEIIRIHTATEELLTQSVRNLESHLESFGPLQAHAAALRSQVAALQAEIAVFEHSRSWWLTAPLRGLRRRLDHLVYTWRRRGEERRRKKEMRPAAAGRPAERGPLPKWFYSEATADFVGLERTAPVETRIKLIAFYLPQFHPIPENDEWWGKGFTEWASVTRAKPQFEGHYQPHLPGELGFYDLRLPGVQQRQIELARLHGIHAFCYHHYWFHGKKLLRQPLEQILSRPELDFPFCLCWANENWTRSWDGRQNEVLIAQQHSAEDDLAFIRDIEPALRDRRYVRIDGRPLLIVYRPALFPDAAATAARWRRYCREAGIGDLFLMSTHAFDRRDPREFGFDAAVEFAPNNMPTPPLTETMPKLNPGFRGVVYDYRELVAANLAPPSPDGYELFRSVTPMWDNEARRPSGGSVFAHSSPALYGDWLKAACRWTEGHLGIDKPFVFVNAWNEWAEGAHLEPDRRYGYAYLRATAEALAQFPIRGSGPSIVVVSHDGHLHGAQLIALNIVRTLATRFNYQVEVIMCGPGPLTTEFQARARVHDFGSPLMTREAKLGVVRRLYEQGARIAICNTTVVGESVELLSLAGFSVVSLVHELPGLIQERGLETSAELIARHADRVVFPSTLVRDRFIEVGTLQTARSAIQPQGLYAPNKFFGRRDSAREALRARLGLGAATRVILGVGFADHRKGIDLFADVGVRVARQLADVTFVWVGDQEPAAFAAAGASIERAGVNDRFVFAGKIRDSDLFFAGADAYLMTSREDPFPSVVLEALDADLPIIGFEGAGGFVELLQRGCGVVVPFEDTGAMAEALLRILGSPDDRRARVPREILSREFSFVNYVRSVVELVGRSRPKVSVVVPSYNYARYLPARLKSIIDQTYAPFEILFLDDCSTDGSAEIAAELLHASGLSYRIVSNEVNQGTYRQWLRGIREAKGDLIWIAEADDECAPDMLERLIGQFEHPDVMLAYCQSRQIDEEGRELAPDYLAYTADISSSKWCEGYVRPGVQEICDTLAVKNTIPNVSAVLMRRTDLSGIEDKLLALRNTGDYLLYVHLLERGHIAFVPEALNSHRRHASSVTIGRGGLNLMREILMVQQHVIERHEISGETERKREIDRQRTYEYLGLSANGPPSYKDHAAFSAVEWAAMR